MTHHRMLRRLGIVLLALALVTAGVATCPCIAKACAVAKAMRMDCCNDAGDGISAPDCCGGGTQLSQQTASPTATDPIRAVMVVAAHAVPIGALLVAPTLAEPPLAIDRPAGPPGGGTLITQHTSLLL